MDGAPHMTNIKKQKATLACVAAKSTAERPFDEMDSHDKQNLTSSAKQFGNSIRAKRTCVRTILATHMNRMSEHDVQCTPS